MTRWDPGKPLAPGVTMRRSGNSTEADPEDQRTADSDTEDIKSGCALRTDRHSTSTREPKWTGGDQNESSADSSRSKQG